MINLKFKRLVDFIGKSGMVKSSGVSVQPWFSTKIVVMQPLTSRGIVGSAQIEVPMEDIPDFIDAVKKSYNEMNPPTFLI
jgi:hypothetical protein